MKKNIFVDNNTHASNPGTVELNKRIWFKHNPSKVIYLILLLIISIVLTLTISYWFIILTIIMGAVNWFYWRLIQEHFISGDSNGGIVVSTNPTLVAVTTNLTKGWGDYPVVKIVQCNSLDNVKINDRLPTVALYTASIDDDLPHWIDFNPIPLSYATDNVETLKQAMQSYPIEQWQQLESRLKELDKPFQVGLYQVEQAESDWLDINQNLS